MYSKSQGAIITGKMTDNPTAGLTIQRFSDAKDPWFYLHVQDRVSKSTGPSSDAIPLPEYLFRYDRGGFWVGAAAFRYFSAVPFNAFTRWCLDDFLHTRMLYNALHGSGESELMIIQDLALPYETAQQFIEYTDSRLGIWPLWLCPLKQSPSPTMHPHLNEYEVDSKILQPMLNIGLWGEGPTTHERFIQANKGIEQKLQELKGMKWLYAQTYFSEEDFWKDFDKDWYYTLRKKYNAASLPTVYDKVQMPHDVGRTGAAQSTLKESVLSTRPFGGLYGLCKAIQSGDYVQARNSAWKSWVPRT